MSAYYNERDAFAAAWLRLLMKAGVIADGEVDERDIRQIEPADLRGFAQCHFFAGIGVWSHALRAAGWPDDSPVWTGSCPCQGFSASGKRGGFSDQRHLWPAWFRLIGECAPDIIFGEQVASKDGLAWLDVVFSDLEGAGYACGAADTCAAGFGAPHIRQRLYFCAHAQTAEVLARPGEVREGAGKDQADGPGNNGHAGDSSHAEHDGCDGAASLAAIADCDQPQIGIPDRSAGDLCNADHRRLAMHGAAPGNGGHTERAVEAGLDLHAERTRLEGHLRDVREWRGPGWLPADEARSAAEAGATRGFWGDCDWWYGRDGKYRPIGSGLFPLAARSANRVGRLRGYGNALCAPQAVAFIQAAREVLRG